MRPVLILAMLLSLPLLMVAHRKYFLEHEQGVLMAKVKAALGDPAFDNVERDKISMNHMDVKLEGFVETPELREKAREKVKAVRGVRCREQDNQLRIPARLAVKMEGETLVLSGWLPNAAAVHDVTQWLTENRPGLQVNTSGVKLSVWVTHPEAPTVSPLPGFYHEAWNAIRVKAGLRVERTDGALAVSGTLPSAELRDAVVTTLAGEQKAVPVKAEGLSVGPYVRGAKFADAQVLPTFLREFFQEPGSTFFEAGGATLRMKGVATAEMETRWRELAALLADGQEVAAELQIFPTRFHFPSYVPESKVPEPGKTALREALKPAVFHFDPNNFYLLQAEVPKLNAALQAIVAAGKEAKIIVGGYTEADGDAKAQQQATVRRCETVIAEFKDRGLPSSQFEMTIYGAAAVPLGADNHRVVELLLK